VNHADKSRLQSQLGADDVGGWLKGVAVRSRVAQTMFHHGVINFLKSAFTISFIEIGIGNAKGCCLFIARLVGSKGAITCVPWELRLSCFSVSLQMPSSGRRSRIMAVGTGVICDTARQAERFATLRSDGKEAEVAICAVNDEIKDGGACRLALLVFTGGEPVAEILSLDGRSLFSR